MSEQPNNLNALDYKGLTRRRRVTGGRSPFIFLHNIRFYDYFKRGKGSLLLYIKRRCHWSDIFIELRDCVYKTTGLSLCSFLVGNLGGCARGWGAAARGGRGMYLQRNAAALALVRKRGGMQSVAFVPPRQRGAGLREGNARGAGAPRCLPFSTSHWCCIYLLFLTSSFVKREVSCDSKKRALTNKATHFTTPP